MRYTRDALDVPYGVVLVPLRSNAGVPLGVMAVAKSFDASRAAAGQSVVWQALLALFGIVTLAGAITAVIRGFLVRPLEVITARLATIATSESGPPVPETDMLCAELQQLAAQHERLRTLPAPAAHDDEGGRP